jgi:type II secretory pathway predicted ATPase ExeA
MPERTTAPPELTALAGLKLGNYRLERLVGRGRMGVVYLAKDEALLRPTAIKVLSWKVAEAGGHDPVQWFLSEARLVARINHPRVVQIYGAARHGDYCYIAMEYVAGQSAEAMVAREPMASVLATDILIQVASALHAAHGSGIVHRDVKPANLLVGSGGVTKLGDFGMALGPSGDRAANARLRVGTPYYTAPEIWRGEAASPASDIYSLGATYFHLLTGRPPYPHRDVASVEQAHLRSPIPDPRELVRTLPASCGSLLQRALAKAPRDRHASAQEVLWDARRVLQDLTSTAPAHPAAPRPREAPEAAPAPARSPLPPATGPLAEVLGFVRQPFSDVGSPEFPRLAEPLAAARGRLLERLEDGATSVVALAGEDGSGAAALHRALAAELGPSRLVLRVNGEEDTDGRLLLHRLCMAAASEEAPQDLEALVARLDEERARRGTRPLVMIEGISAEPPATAALTGVVGAALWTRSFQVLLGGGPGLLEKLARARVDFRGEQASEIRVAPLDREQLARHLRSWIQETLAPHAPPIIITPDALRLVAMRSGGALERVNRIAENMLVLAASERRRTLCSWHAWTASDHERWAGARVELPRRPQAWPPPEVVDVIDACRRGAGMPPWPRGASAGTREGASSWPSSR